MSAALDFSQLRFTLPKSRSATHICYSAVSRDGQYRASKKHDIPAGIGLFKPPPTPETTLPRLAAYKPRDVAIMARIGADCATNPQSPYLPAAYLNRREQLNVMLLSRGATTVAIRLVDSQNRQSTANCRWNDKGLASIRFDMACALPLAGLVLKGMSLMHIDMLDRRGNSRTETVAIVW